MSTTTTVRDVLNTMRMNMIYATANKIILATQSQQQGQAGGGIIQLKPIDLSAIQDMLKEFEMKPLTDEEKREIQAEITKAQLTQEQIQHLITDLSKGTDEFKQFIDFEGIKNTINQATSAPAEPEEETPVATNQQEVVQDPVAPEAPPGTGDEEQQKGGSWKRKSKKNIKRGGGATTVQTVTADAINTNAIYNVAGVVTSANNPLANPTGGTEPLIYAYPPTSAGVDNSVQLSTNALNMITPQTGRTYYGGSSGKADKKKKNK